MKRKLLEQVIFYGLLLGLWEALVLVQVWPSYLFPSPLGVLRTIAGGLRDSSIPVAVGVSLRRIVIGYGISIVAGIALGLLTGEFPLVGRTVGRLVLGLQTLPSICWLPLAMLWFGLNERAISFVVIMGALFSITIATEAGVKSVPRLFINVGVNMGARRPGLFWYIILPAAMPHIVAGLRQGWSFAWRSLMAGEVVFMSLGLGQFLMMGRELNDMNQVVAAMVIIATISIAVDKVIFGRLEAGLRRIKVGASSLHERVRDRLAFGRKRLPDYEI